MADVDGDFDLDILVNHRNGRSRIFLNDGKASFTESEHLYPAKNGPYTYNVEACDFDEDGDLDLLLDNAGGTMSTEDGPRNLSQVLVNDGHGSFSDDTAMRITGEPMGDDNAVKCADLNGDGHYDLLVASLTNPTEKLLINDGQGHFTNVADGFPMVVDPTLGIDVGDLDGDGLLDVVTGQGEGTPRIDRIYKGAGASKKDVTAPKFRAVEKPAVKPDTPIVLRLAVVDAYTSETGEHVSEVSVDYQADGGATKKAKAHFIGGDLFRVTILAQPSGTKLTVTPHAVDRAGLTGSAKAFELMVGEPRPPVRDEPDEDAGVMIDAGSTEPPPGMEPSRSDAGVADAGSMDTPPESGGGAGSMCVAISRVKLTGGTTPSDDSGCSVAAPGGRANNSAVALLGGCMLALFGLRLRRRRTLHRRRRISALLLLAVAACSDDDADGMQDKPVAEEEDAGYWCPPIDADDAGPEKPATPGKEETPRDSGMAAAGTGGAPPRAGAGGGPSRDGNMTPDAGAPDAGGSSMAPDTAAVMRGEAIVMTNTCNGCHQANFAGKGFFPNITPDKDTGIGGWTDDEVKQAITKGIDAKGETLCNLMKRYPFSDSELTDLVAFLRSVPAEVNSIGDVCPGHGM
jgi:hypothetical protein